MPAVTIDTLLHGRLVLRQPARGHRVNLDAVLLAAFAAGCRPPRTPRPGEPPFALAADLGAGTGAVALLLCRGGVAARAACVEAEPELAALCRANITANALDDAVAVLETDLRGPLPRALEGACDLVVANPPYLPLAEGRASPDPLRAAQRHELRGGLPDFVAAARRLLAPGGTLALIYRWRRHAFARETLAAAGFSVVRERRHLPRDGDPPATVCFEATVEDPRKAGTAAAPETLVLHEPGRRFSARVEAFLDGDYCNAARNASSETRPGRMMR